MRGAHAPAVKPRRSGGAGTSTAVDADHPDNDGAVAAAEQQDSPTVGEWNAPGEGDVTLVSLFDPARKSSVTEWKDRLPTITAFTGVRKPTVKGRGPAVADELSDSAARLSTPSAPETAVASQLSSAPETAAVVVAEVPPTYKPAAASPQATLSIASAAAVQPAPARPMDLTRLASHLVTAALESLLAPGPDEPAPPSPALWALLAWTRRQIGETSKTLFDPTPPAAIQTTAAQPFGLPDITAPGSVLTAVSDVVAHELSIYDFADPRGRTAFLLDYSWGLTGTALGGALQIVNTFVIPNSEYDAALSQQLGFFVYNGGIVFFPGFITTLGNVTTNGSGNVDVVENHEAVHVWQSRVFGPFFQVSYVAWLAGGAIVGTAVWLTDTDEDWYSLVETAAYYDNPWEVWAYTNDDNWPPPGANPKLVWKLP